MTRRRWLQRAAAGVWFIVTQVWRLAPGLNPAGWFRPVSAETSEPGLSALSAAELDTLIAFGEVIVDGRPLADDARATLVEAIAARLRNAPDQAGLYRGAARLLEHLAGGRLGDLDLASRTALVARYHLDVRVSADESVADEARFIRTGLARELIAAYWQSAAGWAAVGYQTFPGRCGDLTRYTRRES
jgi:hypothetical protein